MKGFFFILLLFLITFRLNAQSNQYYQKSQKEESNWITTQSWKCEKEGYWGSFWWKVERTKGRYTDGYYYYYVYFWSNSIFNEIGHDGNYKKAVTHISDITVWIEGNEKIYFISEYEMVDYEKDYIGWFSNSSLNTKIKIDYGDVTPYYYSKK